MSEEVQDASVEEADKPESETCFTATKVWFRVDDEFSDYTYVLALALKWKEKGYTVYEYSFKSAL